MKRKWVLTALLVAGGMCRSNASINDRDSDTLAQQGKALPDVVRVITGRFERNPPLYYQMRIARVGKELQLHPERLALYDDIAVANDRLGRDDTAIAWMNRKKVQLAKSSTRSSANHEALYRYYANNGTFWAHRWLRAGANRAKIGEMKSARNLIAQAIKIKPNAHFGREKYQLMTMDWIINPRAKDYSGQLRTLTLADYIDAKQRDESSTETTGLSGLVVLGNAWESVDVFHALGDSLSYAKPTLDYLAILRCRELLTKGKKSLLPDDKSGDSREKQLGIDKATTINNLNPNDSGVIMVNAQNQAAIETVYKRLRTDAEAWQTRRTSYMMARLKAGRHPDTDATFWRDWHDTPAPSMAIAWHSDRGATQEQINRDFFYLKLFFIGSVLLPVSLCLLWKVLLDRRRRLRPG